KGVSELGYGLQATEKPAEPTPSSTIKLSLAGLEVSSSIIGLLVLVVSLGFFYLYLDRVYEIRVLAAPIVPTESP
ncbi:MAG: hypothetical protein ABW063_04110, partial [Caulobacter sp.]